LKITSVEPQKKNMHRFNIFLDGQFAFGADEDLVVERRLVAGKEIAPEDMEKILFDAEVGKLMEKVYGQFNIRMRSEKEVKDYFRRVSFKRKIKDGEEISDMVIEATIDRAKNKGLINDSEFAKAWMEARSKKYGVNRIRQELYQKGIDREIIDRILNNESRIMDGTEVAEKLIEKKMRSWKNLEQVKLKKKAYDYLIRRGFEFSIIKTVVEKLLEKR